jgi:lysophospholipase L1-like esterase/pimeloyl-ACP methyl ester carboxylesterase
MVQIIKKTGCLLFGCLFVLVGMATPVRIACVGNSITYGSGVVNREKNSYPAQLQSYLGADYEVRNFGLGGTTLLKKGNKPYWATEQFRQSLLFQPDIVFIKLGTNDSKEINRPFLKEFSKDLTALVKQYQELASRPRVVLLLPLPAFTTDNTGIYNPVIHQQIHPVIKEVAFALQVELIDFYQLFISQPNLLPDNIHPSSLGATVMAKRLYELVKMEQVPAPDWKRLGSLSGEATSFHGYTQFNGKFRDHTIHVVQPRKTAKGRPWIWRARFWGHEPQLDIALLERGFHLVYCDVSELFGNAKAIGIWKGFYDELQKMGLAPKAVLEGMSRGGIYIYNWALAHPDKVAAIYADAPVLDPKSWPGGMGSGKSSKESWELFKKAYNLTETTARKFNQSPLDKAEQIASLGIPLIHVVGEADEIVPVKENTSPFEQRIRAAGGHITVIRKEGVNHHPHSLQDPTPILNFILRATGYKINFAALAAPGSEYRMGAGWKENADWWKQYQDIDSMLLAGAGKDIVFLGNSITQGIGGDRPNVTHKPGKPYFDSLFSGYKWMSAGISGDRTQHILWRLQHSGFTEAKPKCIVLTIGVNNMIDDSAEEIVTGITACYNWIRKQLPATRLILIGPLPAGSETNDFRRQQYESIHRLLENQNLTGMRYLPLHTAFLSVSGALDLNYFSRDGVHLVEGGYRKWAELLKPVILEELKAAQ